MLHSLARRCLSTVRLDSSRLMLTTLRLLPRRCTPTTLAAASVLARAPLVPNARTQQLTTRVVRPRVPTFAVPTSSSSSSFLSRTMSSSTTPAVSASLDRITQENVFFFLCDVQETFRGKILGFDGVIAASVFLTRVAATLGLPVLTTEQKPFKPTLVEIAPYITADANSASTVIAKSQFSMLTPEVLALLEASPSRRHIVLFGIEAHVCILQTSLDLLRRGYHVHLVVDGVSSQTSVDLNAALDRLRSEGGRALAPASLVFTSAESVIYEMMQDAQHPQFKSLVPAIKEFSAAKKAVVAAATTSSKL